MICKGLTVNTQVSKKCWFISQISMVEVGLIANINILLTIYKNLNFFKVKSNKPKILYYNGMEKNLVRV